MGQRIDTHHEAPETDFNICGFPVANFIARQNRVAICSYCPIGTCAVLHAPSFWPSLRRMIRGSTHNKRKQDAFPRKDIRENSISIV